jgi:hypothetical protein
MKNRSLTRRWLAAAAVAAAAGGVLTLPTAAQADPGAIGASTPANARGSSAVTAEARSAGRAEFGARATDAQAIAAYWTPERMSEATPADTAPGLRKAARAWKAEQVADRKAGVEQKANPGPRRRVAGATGELAKQAAGAGVGAGVGAARIAPRAGGYVYNPNFPYYTPAAYTQGKVFFSMGGGNYVCSGTIVNSEGKDQVWTAGHCVHGGEGGQWASNWAFVPAYDDDLANPRPYGTWTASYLTSRTAWTNDSDFSQDLGVAVMNTNFGGWHIVDYFGGQGITVNRGKSGVWENAFGYTSYGSADGGNLLACYGYTSPEWDAWIVWSQTVKIPCGLNRGASGGAWLWSWNGSWGYLNGVNSRVDSYASPTVVFSAYFDDDAWSLYNYTRYA